jgi:hypothetical protein
MKSKTKLVFRYIMSSFAMDAAAVPGGEDSASKMGTEENTKDAVRSLGMPIVYALLKCEVTGFRMDRVHPDKVGKSRMSVDVMGKMRKGQLYTTSCDLSIPCDEEHRLWKWLVSSHFKYLRKDPRHDDARSFMS